MFKIKWKPIRVRFYLGKKSVYFCIQKIDGPRFEEELSRCLSDVSCRLALSDAVRWRSGLPTHPLLFKYIINFAWIPPFFTRQYLITTSLFHPLIFQNSVSICYGNTGAGISRRVIEFVELSFRFSLRDSSTIQEL